MDDREDLISPIKVFPKGCCINCGSNLVVIDMETSFVELSDDGTPVNITEETVLRVEGVCRHCGARYPMIRYGLNYLHENEYTKLCLWYNHMLHCRQVEKDMDALKPNEGNPFCIGNNREG